MTAKKFAFVLFATFGLALAQGAFAGEGSGLKSEDLKQKPAEKISYKEPAKPGMNQNAQQNSMRKQDANQPQRSNFNGKITASDLKVKQPEKTSSKEPANPGCMNCND